MPDSKSSPSKNAGVVFLVIAILFVASQISTLENKEERPTKITPLITNDVEYPVVANVRFLDVGNHAELTFTEPLRGLFSTAPADRDCLQLQNCQWVTYNLSNDSHNSAPVRVSHAEIDGQGHWVVADIGILHPSNEKEGRIVMINALTGEKNTLIDNIGRTVCAEPGDLDADGDIDLTLCEFGHDEGTVSWLENDAGDWVQHILDPRPGSIHALPVDVDSDGDLDIVAVLSQLSEEVML